MRIFVTGAAGLIGGEVSRRLVAKGHRVTALVHRNLDVRGNDGDPVAVHGVIRGDLARPRLGWSKTEHGVLARDHDLIIHCAATTRFDLSDAEYDAVNVEGTARIIELARAGEAALLQVGTAYVCGMRDGPVGEGDPLPTTGFANGYEASKAAGEALIAASGVSYAIVRPSIVVGEHATGAIRQFDAIYAAFKLIAEGRVRHMAASPDATLDFVPIDHVAAGIVAVAERMKQANGGRFHLVSGRPMPVQAFAAAIGAYPQFHAPTLVAARSVRRRRAAIGGAAALRPRRRALQQLLSARAAVRRPAFPSAHRPRLPADRHRLSDAADRPCDRTRFPA